jgi:RNA polymerase sigma-70 factor (ECF subfamily)
MLLFLLFQTDEKQREKFEKLYDQYKDLMMYIAMHILHNPALAEEAVQDSLEKIFIHIDDIKEIKCHETKRWVVIVSERVSLDKLKYESRRGHEKEEMLENLNLEEVSLEDIALKDITVENILKHLRALDYKYYSVIILRYYYGFTDKKLAEHFDVSPDVIRKRCERGRKMLIEKLVRDEAIEYETV